MAAFQADLSPPLPLLVTGIAGVAGYNALAYFSQRYPGQVIGIRQQDNWRLAGENIVSCNAEDADGLARLFDQHPFASVLNCAGNCALRACELDPPLAWRTNVEGVRNLLEVLEGRATRLVHLSIDLVYSGATTDAAGLRETTAVDPVTEYGKTMVASEAMVRTARPEACILRISLPMGVSFNGHAGAIDWIQSRFQKQRPATLYYDEVRTPTYTDCLNPLMEQMLASDTAGLFHCGGPRRLSLYQIAQVINRVGGYDPDLLHGCPRYSAGVVPPRAGNVAMDSSALAAHVGYAPFDPWPLDDAWTPTDRNWHHERSGEAGSPELLAEILYRNPARS